MIANNVNIIRAVIAVCETTNLNDPTKSDVDFMIEHRSICINSTMYISCK